MSEPIDQTDIGATGLEDDDEGAQEALAAAVADLGSTERDEPADEDRVPRSELRKVQREAKNLRTRLQETERAQMTEQEQVIARARDETRAEVVRDYGGRLVDAAIGVASAGRLGDDQRAALFEGLDRSRFLTDDGEVDQQAVARFVDRIAPAAPPPSGGARMGQGRQPQQPAASVATGRERYEQRHGKRTTTT